MVVPAVVPAGNIGIMSTKAKRWGRLQGQQVAPRHGGLQTTAVTAAMGGVVDIFQWPGIHLSLSSDLGDHLNHITSQFVGYMDIT